MTKRIITIALVALLLLSALTALSACSVPENEDGESQDTGVTTLYVYNWGEYISDGSDDCLDANKAFEEWYESTYHKKVRVNYSTFSSNEEMYAKVTSGAVNYDVIVPSDYMIARLIDDNGVCHLRPLNKDNFENLGNLNSDFYGPDATYDYYDEGNVYSIPYFYGMIGIIYNTKMVTPAPDHSWALMWDTKYAGNILQFNNSRDALGSAQYALGIDVNTDDEEQWKAALEKLKVQKPILQGYVMDEIYNKMQNGSAAIAAYYAGDYLTMYEAMLEIQHQKICGDVEECAEACLDPSVESLEFYYPKEGTNLYVDAMCIPKSSKNPEIAERYIDFMLSEEPAVANALYTYYASPNDVVRNSEEYIEGMADIKDNAYDLIYTNPREIGEKGATYYENLTPEKLALINELWEELKSDAQVSAPLYIICGVIVAAIAAFAIFFAIRRKKRAIY